MKHPFVKTIGRLAFFILISGPAEAQTEKIDLISRLNTILAKCHEKDFCDGQTTYTIEKQLFTSGGFSASIYSNELEDGEENSLMAYCKRIPWNTFLAFNVKSSRRNQNIQEITVRFQKSFRMSALMNGTDLYDDVTNTLTVYILHTDFNLFSATVKQLRRGDIK